MTAIFKRETKSYFTGMIGYVVIAVLVAFIGLYYSANCLVYGSPDFSSVLYSTTIAMLFVLPALSMRSFADERRNKTDQLLLTSPITIPQIVLGKYLAQLAVFAVPMLLACLLPLLLSAFGEVLLAGAYATLLAYFLLGAACIAVGTFVSVLTENQIIAYLATFGLLLVSYLMEDIQTLFTTGSTMAFIIFSIALVAGGETILISGRQAAAALDDGPIVAVPDSVHFDYKGGTATVETGKDSRALAGLSMGGIQTLNACIARPECFSYIGVFSSGWWAQSRQGISQDTEKYYEKLKANKDVFNKGFKQFWFSMGGKEDIAYRNCQTMLERFDEIGIKYTYFEMPGGHTWPVWRESLYRFAPLLFRGE